MTAVEEVSVPRALVLDLVKMVSKRHPGWPIPRLDAAITVIANVGLKQGYKTTQ